MSWTHRTLENMQPPSLVVFSPVTRATRSASSSFAVRGMSDECLIDVCKLQRLELGVV
jgi:hypothetical protein